MGYKKNLKKITALIPLLFIMVILQVFASQKIWMNTLHMPFPVTQVVHLKISRTVLSMTSLYMKNIFFWIKKINSICKWYEKIRRMMSIHLYTI